MSFKHIESLLSPETCYPALVARDARFDGRFFVGVTSTGIYCRPVCRVRTAKRENCRFFETAAQAEALKFRPCLKCRPELAPRFAAGGTSGAGGALEPAWTTMDASKTLARQAAAWLDACDDAEASIEDLAAKLGITSRHLRRIFAAEHGVTPLQYLQTRRLLLAKQLLTDTDLPVGDVAHAAGFASLRRFNAAFLEHYRLQPTALRREAAVPLKAAEVTVGRLRALRLAYREPYDIDALLAFLAPRAVAGVETVDAAARTIARSVAVAHGGRVHEGWLRVTFGATAYGGHVGIEPSPALWPAIGSVLPLVRRWLDLDAEPQAIAAVIGAADGAPGRACEGLRLPGCLDRFELAVRAVLGQQVTVAAARTLAARFVERFGRAVDAGQGAPAGADRLFPTPAAISVATPERIAELGIIRRRADVIVEIARRWPELAYARMSGSIDDALAELTGIAGIGPWTAHYMLMRGWSWPDAFPPGDVILRQRLSRGLPAPVTPKQYLAAAERWRPYRSYAVLQLWRETP